ncbi:hypothetical protein [Streptomyces sp. NBC_01727]|uniref:hypothetical protein n=1 Tax=Streptomyces sp. NBC_01727 TaxID=2975924 RepID=UPI002E11F68E|nr:hypothetical protein OIE76_34305 [Streptomyces sp. NBC_01727]
MTSHRTGESGVEKPLPTGPATVPHQEGGRKPGASRPAAPPEPSFTGRVHANAMQDATLRDLARRIPAALGRTFRPAWSVDRHMVVTVLLCQLLSGIGTAVMLASVADAMGPRPRRNRPAWRLPAPRRGVRAQVERPA